LISRGIDSPLAVNVFVTPSHPPRQDIEASLRLLDAVKTVYRLDIDTEPLKRYARELEDHYSELAERIQRMEKDQGGITPSDRTFV
ncbi:MAG: proteasome assembly chaperone family protein, partial [Halobacteria archaeon]|nr:proteasome assembly chaperone family protein [Halobacteria archaeon]